MCHKDKIVIRASLVMGTLALLLFACNKSGGGSPTVAAQADIAGSPQAQTTSPTTEQPENSFGTLAFHPQAGDILLKADDSSAIKGSAVFIKRSGIPLKDGETLKVEIVEGAPLPADSTSAELRLSKLNVTAHSNPVLVRSTPEVDLLTPMTIALPLPPGAGDGTGLGLAESVNDVLSRLVVFYRVKNVADDRVMFGFDPYGTQNVQVWDGYIYYSTYHFGWFQASILDRPQKSGAQTTAIKYPIQAKDDGVLNPITLAVEPEPMPVSIAEPTAAVASEPEPVIPTSFDAPPPPKVSVACVEDSINLLVTCTFRRDVAAGLLKVPVVLSGSAQSGIDYQPLATPEVTFTPSSTTALLVVVLLNDSVLLGEKTLDLAVESVNEVVTLTGSVDPVIAVTNTGTTAENTTATTTDAAVETPAVTEPSPSLISVSCPPSVAESDGSLICVVTRTDSENAITVRYSLGGTALGSNVDYTDPGQGVLAIPAGATEGDIIIPVIDDTMVDGNVDIVLTIVDGAEYFVVGDREFDIALTDNDAPEPEPTPVVEEEPAPAPDPTPAPVPNPTLSLSCSPFEVVEGSSDSVTCTISRSSGTDALDASYGVTGTAKMGQDFTALTGRASISSGSSSTQFTFKPIDDQVVDGRETVVLSMAAGQSYNAAPGSIEIALVDDDYEILKAPRTNLAAYLDPTVGVTLTKGTRLIQGWKDVTGNGNDAAQSSMNKKPTLATPGLNNLPSIYFDGQRNILKIGNSADFNTDESYDAKTVGIVFRATGDITRRQVVYEEGGDKRGLSIYLDRSQVYVCGWNLEPKDAARLWVWWIRNHLHDKALSWDRALKKIAHLLDTSWGPQCVSTSIVANRTYYLRLVLDATSETLKAFVNGGALGVLDAGVLFRHPGHIGMGGVAGQTYFHDGASKSSSTYNFEGLVGDFLYYNGPQSSADADALDAFLLQRYGLDRSSPIPGQFHIVLTGTK